MAWTLYKNVIYTAVAIPGSDLTGFPVPVWITTDADIAAELSGGGGIKFTSADGLTDLPFGLYPSSNLAAGTVHARVKIDPDTDATATSTVAMRLYYSSSESTTENKAGTVANGFIIFAPLEEDPSGSAPQMFDWVSATNIGTSNGTMTSGDLVAGQVGNGLDFDGSDDWISFGKPANLKLNRDFTVGLWVNPNDTTDARGLFGWANSGWVVDIAASTNLVRFLDAQVALIGTSTDACTATEWTRVDVAVDADGGWVIYVDGVSSASGTTSATLNDPTSPSHCAIGGYGTDSGLVSTTEYPGKLDEVMAASVARSSFWIAYTYTTDFNKSSLWTLSAEQGGAGGLSIPIAAYHYRHRIGA